jgi:ficolin
MTINSTALYIHLETFEQDNVDPFSAYAEYSTFKINDESDKYRLAIGGYSGSCSDSMPFQNNQQFSTKDSDNDPYSYHCAEIYGGGWWYNTCHFAHLNGMYLGGADTDFGRGIIWESCWGYFYSLKKTVMKIRRNN